MYLISSEASPQLSLLTCQQDGNRREVRDVSRKEIKCRKTTFIFFLGNAARKEGVISLVPADSNREKMYLQPSAAEPKCTLVFLFASLMPLCLYLHGLYGHIFINLTLQKVSRFFSVLSKILPLTTSFTKLIPLIETEKRVYNPVTFVHVGLKESTWEISHQLCFNGLTFGYGWQMYNNFIKVIPIHSQSCLNMRKLSKCRN